MSGTEEVIASMQERIRVLIVQLNQRVALTRQRLLAIGNEQREKNEFALAAAQTKPAESTGRYRERRFWRPGRFIVDALVEKIPAEQIAEPKEPRPSCDPLNDPDKRTRLANIEWAGDSKNRTKIAALLDIIRWDADPDIVYQAMVALGKIGDPIAVPALIDKAHSLDSSIRLAVAWALGEIGDARAMPTLQKMITHHTILARLGTCGAVPKEANAGLSEEARRALAKISRS